MINFNTHSILSQVCIFMVEKILKYWFIFMLIIGIIWNYFSWVSFDNLYFSRDTHNLSKSFSYFSAHCYQINIPLYSNIFICAESFFLIEHSFINYFLRTFSEFLLSYSILIFYFINVFFLMLSPYFLYVIYWCYFLNT